MTEPESPNQQPWNQQPWNQQSWNQQPWNQPAENQPAPNQPAPNPAGPGAQPWSQPYPQPSPMPYAQAQSQPYGQYMPPAPQIRGWSGQATGGELLSATWALLKKDRELILLPVIGTIAGVIAGAALFAPGFAFGLALGGTNHVRNGLVIGGALFGFASTVVAIYFQAALVIGAMQRADGGDPTLGGVLGLAWQRIGKILGWALLTTTVGMALRAAEQRLGILGKIVGFLGGLAWAVASFLAVPVVVAEDLGPIDAVKRSGQLIRQTWGTSLRTTLRFGFTQFLLTLPLIAVLFVGVMMLSSGPGAGVMVGVVLIVVAVLGLVALGMVFNAISTYARALIYRYATGRPVPGVNTMLFTGVFRPKRG